MSDGIQVDATGVRVADAGVVVTDAGAPCCCSGGGGVCDDCPSLCSDDNCGACGDPEETPGCFVVTVSGMANCGGNNPNGTFLLTHDDAQVWGYGACAWVYSGYNFDYVLYKSGTVNWGFFIEGNGACLTVWPEATTAAADNLCNTNPPTQTNSNPTYGGTATFAVCVGCTHCSTATCGGIGNCDCDVSGSGTAITIATSPCDGSRYECQGGSSPGMPYCETCNGVTRWRLLIGGGTCVTTPPYTLQCPGGEGSACNVALLGPLENDGPEGSYGGYTCNEWCNPGGYVTGGGTVSNCTDGI